MKNRDGLIADDTEHRNYSPFMLSQTNDDVNNVLLRQFPKSNFCQNSKGYHGLQLRDISDAIQFPSG